MKSWAVYAPLRFAVVRADTSAEARRLVLESAGLGAKPYLARDWEVHEATDEEIDRYAAFADNQARSRKTADVVKNPKRSVRDRLL